MKRAHVEAAIAAAVAEALEPMVEQRRAVEKLITKIEAETARQIAITAAMEAAPPRPSKWADLADDGTTISRLN